jgi:hypothetical protein
MEVIDLPRTRTLHAGCLERGPRPPACETSIAEVPEPSMQHTKKSSFLILLVKTYDLAQSMSFAVQQIDE